MILQAQKDALKRYYQKNKDRLRKYNSEYRKNNAQKIRDNRIKIKEIIKEIEKWNKENGENTIYEDWIKYIKARDE